MPHKLTDLRRPVPSDLDIAQAATPLPITQIAAEAGILPEELEMFGNTKAKVSLDVRERLKDAPPGQVHRRRPRSRPRRWVRARRRPPSA
jgi:hypothetical protein